VKSVSFIGVPLVRSAFGRGRNGEEGVVLVLLLLLDVVRGDGFSTSKGALDHLVRGPIEELIALLVDLTRFCFIFAGGQQVDWSIGEVVGGVIFFFFFFFSALVT
jgi:hypothetical protein